MVGHGRNAKPNVVANLDGWRTPYMKSVRKESNCQSLMTMKISLANLRLG
jgi:hypothetical protein